MRPIALAFALLTCFVGFGLLTGCSSNEPDEFKEFEASDAPEETHGHHHDHEHEAPHGGALLEVGDHQYHVEFVCDEDSHKFTIYVLDGEAVNGHPVEETELVITFDVDGTESEYKLAAMPLDGEPEGQSSRFEIASEELVDLFHEHEGLEGELDIIIDGESHHVHVVHEEHDHEHEHEGEDGAHDHDEEGHHEEGDDHDEEGHHDEEDDDE